MILYTLMYDALHILVVAKLNRTSLLGQLVNLWIPGGNVSALNA